MTAAAARVLPALETTAPHRSVRPVSKAIFFVFLPCRARHVSSDGRSTSHTTSHTTGLISRPWGNQNKHKTNPPTQKKQNNPKTQTRPVSKAKVRAIAEASKCRSGSSTNGWKTCNSVSACVKPCWPSGPTSKNRSSHSTLLLRETTCDKSDAN